MFSSGSNTFLSIRGSAWRVRGFDLAKKNGDELIHTGIGEQEVRRVGHERAGGHDGVLFFVEEIEETLADFGAGHIKSNSSFRLSLGAEATASVENKLNLGEEDRKKQN